MRIFALLFLTAIGFCSCNNNLTTIGQDLVFNGNNIELKTFQLPKTGTIRLDSFPTSSGIYGNAITEMYMGKMTDLYSGTTRAYPCFQIVPAYQPSISRYAYLDSVTFQFTYGGKLWGDTLSNLNKQIFELYRLSRIPELNTDDIDKNNYFYNNDSIPWGEKLATCSFIPRIRNMKYAYFKLTDTPDLLNEMFEKMKYGDEIFSPNSGGPVAYYKFMQYFHGLAIKADENNDCILTIQALPDSLYMRFHYHEGENSRTFDLKLLTQTTEFQYNGIYTTLPDALSGLKDQRDEVPFEQSGYSIIQGLNAYMAKMVLPQPTALDAYSAVIKAEIVIKPYVFTNDPFAMPPTISVYETNKSNEIRGLLYNVQPGGTSAGTAITGVYEKDDININNSRYVFDITDYYQRISSAAEAETNRYQMLLSIPNVTSSFNRMLIKETPVLNVYYANYN